MNDETAAGLLARIESEAAVLRRELAALEAAAAILRGRPGGSASGALAGLTAAEAARLILMGRAGSWLTCGEVAWIAGRRGCRIRGGLPGPGTFYRAMRRRPDVFEGRGPLFRIRTGRG